MIPKSEGYAATIKSEKGFEVIDKGSKKSMLKLVRIGNRTTKTKWVLYNAPPSKIGDILN